MSSMSNTLFVKHSIKLESFLSFNFKNFDLLPPSKVSTSTAKSKLLIVSTLSSVIKSLLMNKTPSELIPDLAVEVIPVSAKFFSPLVWTSLLTGSIISSNVCGLWIVYDKFW